MSCNINASFKSPVGGCADGPLQSSLKLSVPIWGCKIFVLVSDPRVFPFPNVGESKSYFAVLMLMMEFP